MKQKHIHDLHILTVDEAEVEQRTLPAGCVCVWMLSDCSRPSEGLKEFLHENQKTNSQHEDARLPVFLQTQVTVSAEFAVASLFNFPILTL